MTTRDLYHLQRFSQQHRAVLLAKSAGLGRGFRYLCRNNVSWWITLTGTYRTTALEFSCRPSRLMRLTAFTLIPFVCACHCYLHAQPSKLSALTKCSAENSTYETTAPLTSSYVNNPTSFTAIVAMTNAESGYTLACTIIPHSSHILTHAYRLSNFSPLLHHQSSASLMVHTETDH